MPAVDEQSLMPCTVLYARQPIVDRNKTLKGYEFLFRPADGSGCFPLDMDGNQATGTVLANVFIESGIEKACDGTKAYINFTEETLHGDFPFRPEHLVIEVLETVDVTDENIEALRHLYEQGYTLALDDYSQTDADHPFLPWVRIVKLDFPVYDDIALIRTVIQLKRRYPSLLLLAEKIETQSDYEQCMQAGIDLFQGYFLARPAPVHGKQLDMNHAGILKLLKVLNSPDVTTLEVTRIIERDPALSVQLLKLVNSAYYQRATDIVSIRQATLLLGLQRIRSLASLMALTRTSQTGTALPHMALTRAFLAFELAAQFDSDTQESAFMVGLFSYLDAFFSIPVEQLLEAIPLHDNIRSALLHHEGVLGLLLETSRLYEQDQWISIRWPTLAEYNITPEYVHKCFQQAHMAASQQRPL
ncbi:EAL and HDOD domain-containing protein [Larsenimonas rhizosphaerae]|uniref:HDOD domain-containing protein n=1 Tax=Larsenimonas rhizosphaerae TaxID=2944682 RepID=A0AA42CVG8_9GAMM|nr:HDOD domain-containing protein [Larsenimonas rhizosphaerae]MCM2131712.1 HDOD domain-containing protein [Larsenimonas rhizosphaerae]MCX2524961.1 HDOD domain-containing protein [Larsenimonas rhizosphaerae]